MKTTELLDLIGEVNEDYVLSAGRRAGHARLRWTGWAACAACAVLALTGAFFLRRPAPAPAPSVSASPAPALQPVPTGGLGTPAVTAPPTPALNIDLAEIAVNELPDNLPSGALRVDFHLTHQEVEWTQDDIAAWFGRTDFTPAFLPDGLFPAAWNNTATVLTKDGEVVIDLLRLGFYVDYYEDGGPKSTDECVYARGFDLAVSKHSTHPFRDWLVHEPTVETSDIAGTGVTITHKSYSYGPYDPDTHEPSGYYDWYSAEFTLDGLNYEIDATRLTLEEITAVTASIITGGTHFTVTGGEVPAAAPAEPSPTPCALPLDPNAPSE